MNDDKSNQRPAAPIGGVENKSPADRIRQIQEMQRAAEAAPVQQAAQTAPAAPAAPAAPVTPAQVGTGFEVKKLQPLPELHAAKLNPQEAASYGKVQTSVASLFGGKNDVEIKGEPWKIISFLDAAPALFSPKKPLAEYEPLVSKKGVVTTEGVLCEVGLKAKDGSEPVQKKQVLIGQDGQLRGAECKTPQDLDRLLKAPGFFERIVGIKLPAGAQAKESTSAKFEVRVPGAKVEGLEGLFFNNFGLKVPASDRRSTHDFHVSYHLDQFDAAI